MNSGFRLVQPWLSQPLGRNKPVDRRLLFPTQSLTLHCSTFQINKKIIFPLSVVIIIFFPIAVALFYLFIFLILFSIIHFCKYRASFFSLPFLPPLCPLHCLLYFTIISFFSCSHDSFRSLCVSWHRRHKHRHRHNGRETGFLLSRCI